MVWKINKRFWESLLHPPPTEVLWLKLISEKRMTILSCRSYMSSVSQLCGPWGGIPYLFLGSEEGLTEEVKDWLSFDEWAVLPSVSVRTASALSHTGWGTMTADTPLLYTEYWWLLDNTWVWHKGRLDRPVCKQHQPWS